MESDFVFVAPMIHMANMMSNWTKNLFVFSFDHQSSLAPPPNWLGKGNQIFYMATLCISNYKPTLSSDMFLFTSIAYIPK